MSNKTRLPVKKTVFANKADADLDLPSMSGISHCLAMLASEAAGLGMRRTVDALRRTLVICAEETPRSLAMEADFFDLDTPAPGEILH